MMEYVGCDTVLEYNIILLGVSGQLVPRTRHVAMVKSVRCCSVSFFARDSTYGLQIMDIETSSTVQCLTNILG